MSCAVCCVVRHATEESLASKASSLVSFPRLVIELSKDGYPNQRKAAHDFKVLTEEEDKFNKTIDQGLAILAEMEDAMAAAGEKTPFR